MQFVSMMRTLKNISPYPDGANKLGKFIPARCDSFFPHIIGNRKHIKKYHHDISIKTSRLTKAGQYSSYNETLNQLNKNGKCKKCKKINYCKLLRVCVNVEINVEKKTLNKYMVHYYLIILVLQRKI